MKISGACASKECSPIHPITVTCTGTGQSDHTTPLDFMTEDTNTESHFEIDESELGEFLLDTFEAMEAHCSLVTEIDTTM